MCQLIGSAIEISITQLSISVDYGNSIWIMLRLLLKEFMDTLLF
jgi:hypothetical protein